MKNNNIIVYRSRWQMELDNFFSENPEYMLYIGLVALAVCLLIIGISKFQNRKVKVFQKTR